MVTPRRVVRSKRQLLIPIPPEQQEALHARPGMALYWHPLAPGEVVLSLSPTRRRGQPPRLDSSAAVAALEAEVYRLRARLEKQRAALWNEWQSQAVMQRIHLELKGYPALDAINERLRSIEEALRSGAPIPRRRASGTAGTRQVRSVASPNALASRSLSPVEVERGADTSGAQPPGVPAEH
jgi:hypothetical protein